MRKLWVIAKGEYGKIVRKRSFILGTIAMPLFFIGIMVLVVVFTVSGTDRRPIGYVDEAGVLAAGVTPTKNALGDELIAIQTFADEATAKAALTSGQIQAYYMLAQDFLRTQAIELFYWDKAPAETVQRDFDYFVRAKLAANLPPALMARARDGMDLTAKSADGAQEISGKSFINLLVPFFVGLFFIMTVMNSGNYLLQAVTDEKESRTVEVMATSVTPNQLIGGKAIGLIAVALTQILILVVVIAIGLGVGAHFIDVLKELRVPWSLLLAIALFYIPSYILIAGMMISVGAAVTEVRQGQQIVGALNMLFTLPYFFIIVFFTAPNSTLSTILTLFPTTAFITVTLRWGLTTIPAWELIASWLLLMVSGLFMIWAAARIFRAGMLRYGQRLELREMLHAVRVKAA